jgi:hypothetical protein
MEIGLNDETNSNLIFTNELKNRCCIMKITKNKNVGLTLLFLKEDPHQDMRELKLLNRVLF